MSILAIIPARGGSKRIPKKNIKEFCGKPIVEYSIQAALSAGIFTEVMVSTDDEMIAQIAKAAGAKVPFMRGKEASSDFATTADVLLEVLNRYEQQGIYFDEVCCIYPTAPFVTAEKLQKGYELLQGGDSVMPVVKYSYPIQRSIHLKDDLVYMNCPEYVNTRSQDLEDMYHDCGQFYFLKVEALKEKKALFTEKTVPMVLSDLEVQDIDHIEDWKIAEIKYELMKQTIAIKS
ncbi:MAG: pseudaminic acid cytidylyltransferase [Clostridiales bacterium]|nr:pseudaminic acid cytidylyltransferase [Clostridiales bacterium]